MVDNKIDKKIYFKIYDSIESKSVFDKDLKYLVDACKEDVKLIEGSLSLWLDEFENKRTGYEDLNRVAHMLLRICPTLQLDRVIYEWHQASPSFKRSEMMGWILAEYWGRLAREPKNTFRAFNL